MRDRFCPSTYIVKQLCQFSKRTLNLLDVLVPLLDFPIGSFRLAVSIGAHQLQRNVSMITARPPHVQGTKQRYARTA
jgi:hypothetical protein